MEWKNAGLRKGSVLQPIGCPVLECYVTRSFQILYDLLPYVFNSNAVETEVRVGIDQEWFGATLWQDILCVAPTKQNISMIIEVNSSSDVYSGETLS